MEVMSYSYSVPNQLFESELIFRVPSNLFIGLVDGYERNSTLWSLYFEKQDLMSICYGPLIASNWGDLFLSTRGDVSKAGPFWTAVALTFWPNTRGTFVFS